MCLSPLTTGLLTGASELEDPVITDAVTQMLNCSTKAELTQAALDLTGLVVALGSVLAEHTDCSVEEILATVT